MAISGIVPAIFSYPLLVYSAINHGWAFGESGKYKYIYSIVKY